MCCLFYVTPKNIVAVKLNIISQENIPAKVLLQGPSGAGKTYSALLLAFALSGSWGKIAVLETDYKACNHFSFLGPFHTLLLASPFNPEQFQDAIELCEKAGMKAIIIDTLSAAWNGPGGTLDRMQEGGNSASHWQETLLQTIKRSPCHILATIQVQEEYVVLTKQGSREVDKLGLQPLQQADIHYHFHSVLYLDMQHKAKAFKDRTGFFHENGPAIITEEIAALFAQWTGEEKQSQLSVAMQQRIAACTCTSELLSLLFETDPRDVTVQQAFFRRKQELQAEEGNPILSRQNNQEDGINHHRRRNAARA